MEEHNASVMDKIQHDLLVSPHIVSELFRLITGQWQPNAAQQEQLIAHLMTCQDCRVTLISLLSAELAQLNNSSEGPLQNILGQFVAIHHTLEGLGYEQMGAYAETMIAQGQGEADKRFPLLAKHICNCSGCKATLADILAFLRETGETP
jgi:hypothetical protein